MSLEETIKELKDQIEEEKKKDDTEETVEALPETGEAEKEEEEKPEEKAEEPQEEAKEDPKPEEKAEEKKEEQEEEKLDNSAYARLRREAAAARKKAEALELEVAELKKPKAEPEAKEEAQPEFAPEILEVVQDHRMKRAEREFQAMEAKYRGRNPEYDAVSSEYTLALAQSIKIQNPRLTNAEIADKTKETILIKAAQYVQEGYNPIEELYHEAKDLGFTGKTLKREEAEAKEEKEVKPDMRKVAKNREKSTGMTSSNGKSEAGLTRNYIAEHGITAAEWMKLSTDEKRRLMTG